jgi:uncharacterized protein (TIGR02421 family)
MGELSVPGNRTDEAGGRIDVRQRADFLGCLQNWNARLINHLRCIRVLEAVRWRGEVERDFLAHNGQLLPRVGVDDYRAVEPRINVPDRLADLRRLEQEIARRLGAGHPAARLLLRRCRSAQDALRLIAARGTTEFVWLSREIFGSSLASRTTRDRLLRLIAFLEASPDTGFPSERWTAEAAAQELTRRLAAYFSGAAIHVRTSEALSADAAAGPGYLKLRLDATFTNAEIDLLEAHEGWAHLGTMLSGQRQPIFSLLAKCAPCVTATQEGLAVLTELAAGVCHPLRRRRLAARLRAVMMAEDGADFLDVYRFFQEQLGHDRDAYRHACRVFRGSLPHGVGPFTKDLSYGLGLLELTAHLRTLGDDEGRAIPLIFSGKTCLDDLPDLTALQAEGLLIAGEFIPPPFRDRRQCRQALRDLSAC